MSESSMHVFVWNSTVENPARSEVFHTQEDAWVSIRDMRIRNWPDFIIEFNGNPTENSNFVMTAMAFVQQMMS